MTDQSVPEGGCKNGHPPQPVADAAFCEQVARDLGVKVTTVRTAFIGEDTERVQGVAGWALDRSPDPAERGKMILAWAKKRGYGAFRTSPDEYVSLAGRECKGHRASRQENEALAHLILQYWCANPKRLARVLNEVEIWMNVRDERAVRNGDGAGA